MFQTPTVVKLTAEMAIPSKGVMQKLRSSNDVAQVFPDYRGDAPPGQQRANITTVKL